MQNYKQTMKFVYLYQNKKRSLVFARMCEKNVSQCPMMQMDLSAFQEGVSGCVKSIRNSSAGMLTVVVDGMTNDDRVATTKKASNICDNCRKYAQQQQKNVKTR